jgi:MFS family permease
MLSGLSGNTKLITLMRVLTSTGYSSTIPFLALYLAVQRSTPLYLVGLMYLMQGAAAILSQLFSGLLSDRIGPKRTLVIGYIFAVASSAYMAVLVSLDYSTLLIISTYPIFSLFRGLSLPAGAALLADEKSDMVTNFSLLSMASNLGFALGPAAGGLLVAYTGYAFLFVFSSALGLTTLLLSIFLKEGTYHLSRVKESARPDRKVLAFILITLLGYIVIGQDVEPFALFAGRTLGVSNLLIGYIFSFSGILIVAFQLPVMRLIRSSGLGPTLISSSFFAVLSFLLLYFSVNSLELLAAMGLITFSEMLLVVPSQVWITERSPQTRKGAYQGYYSAVAVGGRSAGAWLGSTFQGLPSSAADAWLLMALLAGLMGVAYALHGRYEKASATISA